MVSAVEFDTSGFDRLRTDVEWLARPEGRRVGSPGHADDNAADIRDVVFATLGAEEPPFTCTRLMCPKWLVEDAVRGHFRAAVVLDLVGDEVHSGRTSDDPAGWHRG